LEEKERKRKGKCVWDKRSKYTSNSNNGHKLQGWSDVGKVRFNKLVTEVDDSWSHSTSQEVENEMLEQRGEPWMGRAVSIPWVIK
jgi:hypothetical protein